MFDRDNVWVILYEGKSPHMGLGLGYPFNLGPLIGDRSHHGALCYTKESLEREEIME